jgi:looped-hinge helix DNA binding domain, AbrB family
MKGVFAMELAKVTSKGQITIPIEIRRKLGIKEGDKVLLIEEQGRVIMMNSSMEALRKAQAAFAGEAERLGLKDEQDVVDLISELRREQGRG